MRKPLFEGAGTILCTPFLDDGINFEEYGRLIDFQLDSGIRAIVVGGIAGEGPTLTEEEFYSAIRFTKERAAGRAVVIAASASNSTAAAAERSRNACQAGADGLLLVGPYYNRATQAGLVRHFEYIADRVDKPIIISNIPLRTGIEFEPSTYAQLARHPRINGVKEVSGRTGMTLQTLALCPEDFYVWVGNDDQIVPFMAMGAVGVISILSNIMPAQVVRIAEAMRAGEYREAALLQRRYVDIMGKIFIEVNPTPLKTGLRLMGYQMGPFRLPLCEMSPEHLEIFKESMHHAGLI